MGQWALAWLGPEVAMLAGKTPGAFQPPLLRDRSLPVPPLPGPHYEETVPNPSELRPDFFSIDESDFQQSRAVRNYGSVQ